MSSKLADFLLKHAGPDGRTEITPQLRAEAVQLLGDFSAYRNQLASLEKSGQVSGAWAVIKPPGKPPEKPPSEAKPATPNAVPTRLVGKEDQNYHAWELLRDPELQSNELAVAMRLHYYCFGPKAKPGFRTEIAMETLALHCNVGLSTLKRVASALVKRGYFRRIDNRKGGRNGGNKAVFVPTLPAWKN